METTDPHIDAGKQADWGRTSTDYGTHRKGPPDQFYDMLAVLGLGVAGQRIADLATGTGLLACEFARRGASVEGIDIADGQLDMARATAKAENLDARFTHAPAEDTGLEAGQYDVVTANQCWLYFDKPRAAAEVRRLLKPNGTLVISHFSFLPLRSKIVAASEAVVLKHNPDWSGANWPGAWDVYDAPEGFARTGALAFDVDIPFDRTGWRGRMRALRGIGATLDESAVQAFDEEHNQVLTDIAPDTFVVPHRIEASIFEVAR